MNKLLFFIVSMITMCSQSYSQNTVGLNDEVYSRLKDDLNSFFDCKIYFENGKSKIGEAKFILHRKQRVLEFNDLHSGIDIKIESEKINKIEYFLDSDTILFIKNATRYKVKGKPTKEYWLKIDKRNGPIKVYSTVTIISHGTGDNYTLVLEYYCQNNNEDYPFLVSTVGLRAGKLHGNDLIFRTHASKYFSNNHSLSNKINSKEYKFLDLFTVVRIHEEWIKEKED